MLSRYLRTRIRELLRARPLAPIEFVHCPKTGGMSVRAWLGEAKTGKTIIYKKVGHGKKTDPNSIAFVIVRHPVNRFESLIRYRRGSKRWNQIASRKDMTMDEVIGEIPANKMIPTYRTQSHYANGVELLLEISEVREAVSLLLGWKHAPPLPHRNATNPTERMSAASRLKTKRMFRADMDVFHHRRKQHMDRVYRESKPTPPRAPHRRRGPFRRVPAPV